MKKYLGNMEKYLGNMKKYLGNMKKYLGNMKKYVGNMKNYVEGSKTWKNFELYLLYSPRGLEERSTEQSEVRVVVYSFLPIWYWDLEKSRVFPLYNRL